MMRVGFSTVCAAFAFLISAGAFAPSQAMAGEGGFCVDVLIGAKNTCQHGTYHSNIYNVDGRSTGSAGAGVWVANSNGERISQRDECPQPGCLARIGITGAVPNCQFAVCWNGFSAVNNPMTFTSRFRGYLRFN